LSRVFEQKQAVGDQEAMSIIKDVSPVAWQHVNLFGQFDFNQTASKVDIDIGWRLATTIPFAGARSYRRR
jgi:hypothetical protein